jgi:hypothetical protein
MYIYDRHVTSLFLIQRLLKGPFVGEDGVKAYVIGGRHSLQVAKAMYLDNALPNRDASIMRDARVYLLSTIGEYGSIVLAAQDNQMNKEAAAFEMTFLDRVCYLYLYFIHQCHFKNSHTTPRCHMDYEG